MDKRNFDVTDAASGAEVLARGLTLNRVCLHIGGQTVGAERMACELACLNVGEGITYFNPFAEQRLYVQRIS
jgi:hypothetical protein